MEEYKEDYKQVLDKRRPCDNIHPYDSPNDKEDIIRDLKYYVVDYSISRITVFSLWWSLIVWFFTLCFKRYQRRF